MWPQADATLLSLPVSSLPGVGWALQKRLTELKLDSVSQLRTAGRARLQRDLGDKVGPIDVWDSADLSCRPACAQAPCMSLDLAWRAETGPGLRAGPWGSILMDGGASGGWGMVSIILVMAAVLG